MLSGMKRLLLFLATATLALAADISGNWTFSVETDMGTGAPNFTFQQKGEALTGTYSGQLGDAKVTGKVVGTTVNFWFEASPTGERMVVKYAGTIEGDNKMSGTVDLGGQAKGKFTATKK